MKTINGAYLEGGGAILRLAAGFSVLKQVPLKVTDIRKNRPTPGLKHQHLAGLRAMSELCGGELKNARIGSTEVVFYPKPIYRKKISIKIDTAGSVGLVLQAVQLACVSAPHAVEIEVEGGAVAGKFAPPLAYLQHVTLSLLEKMGYKIGIVIKKHGFYPVGGADVLLKIKPCAGLKPLVLDEQGVVKSINGLSVASRHLEKQGVAERQANAARKCLSEIAEPDIEVKYVDAACPGSFIALWLDTDTGAILGSSATGERGLSAEKVGEHAAKEMAAAYASGATVDAYASDQIIPFMALASGPFVIKAPVLTKHTETNIWLSNEFTGAEFKVGKSRPVEISCASI